MDVHDLERISSQPDGLASILLDQEQACNCLFAAVRHGHLRLVKRLLEHGVDVHLCRGQHNKTAFHEACHHGQLMMVKDMLSRDDTLINAMDKFGKTGLHSAVFGGRYEIASMLLDAGANPNAMSQYGITPLYLAIRRNELRLIDLLKQHGARLDDERALPLILSSSYGHTDTVSYLLSTGEVDVNRFAKLARPNRNNAAAMAMMGPVGARGAQGRVVTDARPSLSAAAANGHLEVVRLLLAQGAECNLADSIGWTALHAACRRGHLDVAQELLQHGAAINQRSNRGLTPLHAAAAEGQDEVVCMLLNAGADMKTHHRSLKEYAIAGGSVQLLQHILKFDQGDLMAGLDVPPFLLACKGGKIKMLEFVLERCDVDLNEEHNVVQRLPCGTALALVCHYGHAEAVQYLISIGCRVEQKVNYGRTRSRRTLQGGSTALTIAIQRGHVQVVQRLLEANARFSHMPKSSLTPLCMAVLYEKLVIAELLLTAGADVNEVLPIRPRYASHCRRSMAATAYSSFVKLAVFPVVTFVMLSAWNCAWRPNRPVVLSDSISLQEQASTRQRTGGKCRRCCVPLPRASPL
eukprot:TRINITY_DN10815_c0_g1_i1.p1 TRINITY_DN10815_c0_g1~~TRINITY_DN10815_c0_g1_i1.p1  ORF type:complete len:579 (+),score=82.62 TRINITY_DN10815_c0_g1_i1:109-1845(+)